jgi:hypothetical protein
VLALVFEPAAFGAIDAFKPAAAALTLGLGLDERRFGRLRRLTARLSAELQSAQPSALKDQSGDRIGSRAVAQFLTETRASALR